MAFCDFETDVTTAKTRITYVWVAILVGRNLYAASDLKILTTGDDRLVGGSSLRLHRWLRRGHVEHRGRIQWARIRGGLECARDICRDIGRHDDNAKGPCRSFLFE